MIEYRPVFRDGPCTRLLGLTVVYCTLCRWMRADIIGLLGLELVHAPGDEKRGICYADMHVWWLLSYLWFVRWLRVNGLIGTVYWWDFGSHGIIR